MNYRELLYKKPYLAGTLLLAIIIVIPIVIFGIPDTVDLPQHFRFAQTFYDSIINGNGFPSWASHQNFGYGDIGIRFYPPLAYYFLAFARIITGNWFDAAWIAYAFWMVIGCIGIYYWSISWLNSKHSAIVSIIFIFTPYHLHQLFTGFNNFSELAATSLLAFCFAFITKIFQRDQNSDILGLGFFYGLLILTHLPSAFLGSLCLLVYSLLCIRKGNFYRPILKLASSVAIGLTASSFYWIKLITEMKWLNVTSDQFSSGHFSIENNFFPNAYFSSQNHFQLYLIIDSVVILTFLLLVISALFYFFMKKKNNVETNNKISVLNSVLPLGIFAFLMVTFISKPLWGIIPMLQKIQFPIRFMGIVGICTAIIAGTSFCYLLENEHLKKPLIRYFVISFTAVILFFNLLYIVNPMAFVPIQREKFTKVVAELPETQSFDCMWTMWAKPEAFDYKTKVAAADRKVNIISWKPEERIFEVTAGQDTSARVATFYYPYWKAEVNGKNVDIDKDQNGVILIPLNKETSTVKLKFVEPYFVRVSYPISFLTWIIMGLLILFIYFKRSNISKQLALTN